VTNTSSTNLLFTLTAMSSLRIFDGARVRTKDEQQARPRRVSRAGWCAQGKINALGLIDEVLHYLIGLYCEQRAPEPAARRPGRPGAALGAGGSGFHADQIRG